MSDKVFGGDDELFPFIKGRKGGIHLVHNNYVYRSNLKRQGLDKNVFYWECIYNRNSKCRGRVKTIGGSLHITNANGKCAASLQRGYFKIF